MKHRFRYLDERGQQIEVTDLAALREHALAGRVDDETLLYDSLTDEWAPAAAHSAFRLLDDPLAKGAGTGSPEEATTATGAASSVGEARSPGGEVDDGMEQPADGRSDGESDLGGELGFPDLDVTLAPDDEAESADEVVEKLLKERERDGGIETLSRKAQGFSRPAPPERAPAAPPSDDTWGSGGRTSGKGSPGPRRPHSDDEPIRHPRSRSRERRRQASRAAAARKPSARGSPSAGWRQVDIPGPVVLVGLVLVAVLALYGVARLMDPSGAAEASTAGDAGGGTVPTSPNSTWAAAEGGAFRDMVEGVDSLRSVHSVQRIPPAWLAGPYLADADDFPGVRDYWSDYIRFVDAVRSQDTLLFRRSFVARLEEQDITGPMASIRLARALETFRESQPARDTVYARMEDLAASALDLHELLVERSDDIVYDPVTEERPSRQPILEAWSDDPYLRQTIWALLDRITANLALLEYDAGSGRSDITERLFQELRTRSAAGEPTGEQGG